MLRVIRRVECEEMPFDRFDTATNNFVHATGDKVLVEYPSGRRFWEVEYEDSETVNVNPEEAE